MKEPHYLKCALERLAWEIKLQIMPAAKAEAVEIRCEDDEAVVLFCHQEVIAEVGLIQTGDYKGYGKTIVFTPENPQGECLQW